MHIYFSGIGGTGIGPLALIAREAGYQVSGSDKQDSQYIEYLKKKGIADIHIGQTTDQINQVHQKQPIDWFIYTSSLTSDHPELLFVKEHDIKHAKRDELLNQIITDHQLKLIAVAGTHGKTTTTAMIIWLFKQLGMPVSYSVGAKISFGDMGQFQKDSHYFVYECDEFDRNFLAFHPYAAVITGVAWDHHEIYPTQQDYDDAFRQFLSQSQRKMLWVPDRQRLHVNPDENTSVLDPNDENIARLNLVGQHNRTDGWQALKLVQAITKQPIDELINHMNNFPGLSRRFEEIDTNLYTDYAHTPEKIAGAIAGALEKANGQPVVVVYEPLTNRRLQHTQQQHQGLFRDISKLYWVPSYLAREDPKTPIISPQQAIDALSKEEQDHAATAKLDDNLKSTIAKHLANGDLVLCLSGGGGGSLDEWLRQNFKKGE